MSHKRQFQQINNKKLSFFFFKENTHKITIKLNNKKDKLYNDKINYFSLLIILI